MNVIDQNTALFSLERNLVPGRSLIDDRSERDRLFFLSQFASLINFYDENNKLSGNWRPFLLKDPVFLLAAISSTRFDKWHSLYLKTCYKIEQHRLLTLHSRDLGASFNQLFDEFMGVFVCIERWTYYMQKMQDTYDLKTYVLEKVSATFSAYFWALRSFKETLYLSKMIAHITPVEQYYLTDAFRDPLWTDNKNKSPYWQVLGLKEHIKDNTAKELYHALKTTGDELYVFFHTIIQHAAPEYEKLKLLQSPYPDTVLLRTFVSLLKVQQEQLNGLSGKHLEFYYHDILKQSKAFAVPDHVIICAETAKKDAAFHLPAGTLFDAGMDAEKNPVEYASTEKVTLNPAAITAAYTLSSLPEAGTLSMLSSLYFQAIPDPGTIKKEEDGSIKQWETFGGSAPPPESRIKLGIAFASPMLLLREGERSIRLTLKFDGPVEKVLLLNACYYVSTAAAWQEIKLLPDASGVTGGNLVTLKFYMDALQPAVEKFLKDPDGLNSQWPMMKIEFSSFTNMAKPPVLKDLEIDVEVKGVKNLQLYNDNGLLTTKTPFQLFGPIPLQGSNFIIGSNEIFSKPFYKFSVKMDWDALPPSRNFADYYVQYNAYLVKHGIAVLKPSAKQKSTKQESATATIPAKTVTPLPMPAPPAAAKKPSVFKRAVTRIVHFFKPKTKAAPVVTPVKVAAAKAAQPVTHSTSIVPFSVPVVPSFFNNLSFTVGFRLLKDHTWKEVDLVKKHVDKAGCVVQLVIPGAAELPASANKILFSVDEDCKLSDTSRFDYTDENLIPGLSDPYIQEVPLVFTDTSASGFVKMTLTGPEFGFGAELYPSLVSDIALQNAALLINADKSITTTTGTAKGNKKEQTGTAVITPPPVFIPPAVMPYVPKLKSNIADYSAKHTYDLTSAEGDYPLQCFFYSPFENYSVYDNTPGTAATKSSAGLTLTGMVLQPDGLPLFPQLDYEGVLYLEIDGLVAADSLNIFFELSRKYGNSPGSRSIAYSYLGATGWKPLKVLADDTNNFTCSGIVKVNVPLDLATDSLVLPEKKSWFSIGVKDNPGSFAQTVYLKTNGFDVQRSGTSFLAVTEKPFIPANTITKTKLPVPQIATIVQPFPSSGGRPAETEITMNQRVSNRIKTKDRAVTAEDYFRLIRQEFDDIYYSKTMYDPLKKTTEIYVVKAYDRATDPSAFVPLVSESKEGEIESFLKSRASCFANINVSNFKIEYVKVIATVVIKEGFETAGVKQNIINAINIFLSPWIASAQQQIRIDQGISDAELAAFIKTIEGVFSVEKISFQTSITDTTDEKAFRDPPEQQGRVVMPISRSALFVPYTTHDIQFAP